MTACELQIDFPGVRLISFTRHSPLPCSYRPPLKPTAHAAKRPPDVFTATTSARAPTCPAHERYVAFRLTARCPGSWESTIELFARGSATAPLSSISNAGASLICCLTAKPPLWSV
jgi:hypothetical protein